MMKVWGLRKFPEIPNFCFCMANSALLFPPESYTYTQTRVTFRSSYGR